MRPLQSPSDSTGTESRQGGLEPNALAPSVQDWPIGVLVRTRLLEFTRKPAAVFWTYVFPLVMMFILGSAFRAQSEPPVEVGLVMAPPTLDQSPFGANSPGGNDSGLRVREVTEPEGRQLLRAGRIALLICPAPSAGQAPAPSVAPLDSTRHSPIAGGISADHDATKLTGYQLLYDPTRSGGRMAELLVRERLRRIAGQPEPVPLAIAHYSEPGARYIDFLIPGLIGMTLLGGGLWGVGYAIVDMRIRKLLKRYLATPMRRSDFLLGIVFSRLLFMFPQVAMILSASYLVFSVQVHGSWFELGFLVVLGGLQFAGVGLLVASRAKTMETMSGLINLAMLPMWTLSGIFFSYQNFPEVMHWPIRLLPLTPLLDTLRGVMLEGKSCWAYPVEMGLIGAWTLGTFAVALKFFRWRD